MENSMTRRITFRVRMFVVGVLALVLLMFGAFVRESSAQVAGGTISGRVTDPSGSILPGASVSITNVSTAVVTNAVTGTDGFYSAVNLLPGPYKIAVPI